MTLAGWAEIALILLLVLAAAWPLGLFMARVFNGERTFLSPVLGPVERGFYGAAGVDPTKEQGWLAYTLAMLALNGIGFLFLYFLQRAQGFLPLNPQGFGALQRSQVDNSVSEQRNGQRLFLGPNCRTLFGRLPSNTEPRVNWHGPSQQYI
jgi:K+-transporting ATPase A subunit